MTMMETATSENGVRLFPDEILSKVRKLMLEGFVEWVNVKLKQVLSLIFCVTCIF